MPNTYRIQVLTKDQTEVGEFCDAQYFDVPITMSIKEFKKQHEDEVETEKAKRIANFVNSVKHPPAEPEPRDNEVI